MEAFLGRREYRKVPRRGKGPKGFSSRSLPSLPRLAGILPPPKWYLGLSSALVCVFCLGACLLPWCVSSALVRVFTHQTSFFIPASYLAATSLALCSGFVRTFFGDCSENDPVFRTTPEQLPNNSRTNSEPGTSQV